MLSGVGVVGVIAGVPQPSSIDLSALAGFDRRRRYALVRVLLAWGGGGQVSESATELQQNSTPFGLTGQAVAVGAVGTIPYSSTGTRTRTRDANTWARFTIDAQDGQQAGWSGEHLVCPGCPELRLSMPLREGWRGVLKLQPHSSWVISEGAASPLWSASVVEVEAAC